MFLLEILSDLAAVWIWSLQQRPDGRVEVRMDTGKRKESKERLKKMDLYNFKTFKFTCCVFFCINLTKPGWLAESGFGTKLS